MKAQYYLTKGRFFYTRGKLRQFSFTRLAGIQNKPAYHRHRTTLHVNHKKCGLVAGQVAQYPAIQQESILHPAQASPVASVRRIYDKNSYKTALLRALYIVTTALHL